MSVRILVIEDDPALQRVLKDNLQFEGYKVEVAEDGLKGLEGIPKVQPDLILLDIMLLVVNGFEVCRRIRMNDEVTPILMLTAKGEEDDIVRGLNLGANDYITKPFRLAELIARVNAHLRPVKRQRLQSVPIGSLVWHPHSAELIDQTGSQIKLTPKERALLQYFIANPDRVFTRDQLLNAVWGHTFIATGRNVDRCITSLRKKLGSAQSKQSFIITERGIGYRFSCD